MGIISKIKKQYNNGSIFELLFLGSIVYNPFFRKNGKKIKEDQRVFRSYQYLKKHYQGQISKKDSYNLEHQESNRIWICWLQGEENAPLLVQKCIQSIREKNRGKNIVVLTYENISEFLVLPEFIMKKWENGIISDAHFSDLIRLEVLINYGGTWMDATIFCTDKLPGFIENSQLFVYQTSYFQDEEVAIVASNWLISTVTTNNEILITTRKMLLKYWEEHNVLINYYVFHIFFTIATQIHNEQWSKVPKKGNIDPHFLQFELNNPYDSEKYEQLKELSPLHKLTYKGLNSNDDDTFYNVLFTKERN